MKNILIKNNENDTKIPQRYRKTFRGNTRMRKSPDHIQHDAKRSRQRKKSDGKNTIRTLRLKTRRTDSDENIA